MVVSRASLILCAPLLALVPTEAAANFPLTAEPVVIDFTGFTGSGFDPAPAVGQLDSDYWVVRGVSDGDSDFGDSLNTGDYAQGVSFGDEADGGVWAFDVGPTVTLGANLTNPDFTPGSFVLRVQNNTGQTIDDFDIAATIWTNNNGNRSDEVTMAYSNDDSSYFAVETITTAEAADLMGWMSGTTMISLVGADISAGEQFYIRFGFDEVSGSGAHDEFGIDDVTIFIHDICGNGVPEAGEDCDDGNTDDTDACVAGCIAAACGDGFVQAGVEGCDDGDMDNTDDCPDGAGGTCQPATCGDTFVQAGVEDCDDGNADNTDDCVGSCMDATCGDGFVHATDEGCDDGNMDNTDDCPDGAGGTCEPAECGDGFLHNGVEECDDGNTVDDDVCLGDCTLPVPDTTTTTAGETDTEGVTTTTATDTAETTDGTSMGLDDTGTTGGPDDTTGGPPDTTGGPPETTSGTGSASATAGMSTTMPGTSSATSEGGETDTDGSAVGEDPPGCGCRSGSGPAGLLLIPLLLLLRRRQEK